MKSLTEHLWFEVPNRRGFVNITRTVEDLVRKSGVREGLCLVNAMHITALNHGIRPIRVRNDQRAHGAPAIVVDALARFLAAI